MSPQLAAQAEAAFGGPLVEIYGCTEAGQVASRRTTAGETWTTLGELRITHDQAGAGPDDERWVVAGGHVVEPTPLADVLELQAPRDGRHFRLLGRANDLIHVAGKRSSLAHLNFHLNRIEGVEDGAFWLPDEVAEGVVRPVAFVVAPRLSCAPGDRSAARATRAGLRAAPRGARGGAAARSHRQADRRGAAAVRTADAGGGRWRRRPPGPRSLGRDGSAPLGDAEFDIPADHPAFAGHFPGQPVLPGVVLLSLVMEALAATAGAARSPGAAAPHRQRQVPGPGRPGTRLLVALREQGAGVAFEVRLGGTPVARGQLSAGGTA